MKRIYKITILILVLYLSWLSYAYTYISREEQKIEKVPKIDFKGFGWYGYMADDEIDEDALEKIKELGGNSVNINVYYEYDTKNLNFILKSNLTKIEEKIDLAHQHKLGVFLSPFVNLVGGHYLANQIEANVEEYLEGAKNISIELAKFSQDNNVEIYAVWNEMGLSLTKISNSTDIVNTWLQNTRREIDVIYDGTLTTKEGVQMGLYRNYNFSGFDYIGATFYPSTTSYYTDPYTNMIFTGVENLEEYKGTIKEEYNHLIELKQKFKSKGIILGEIGIDVVGGNFVGNDNESKKIRRDAYETILLEGEDKIDGFFFSKFEHENGCSEELDEVFKAFFT